MDIYSAGIWSSDRIGNHMSINKVVFALKISIISKLQPFSMENSEKQYLPNVVSDFHATPNMYLSE